MKSGKIVFDPIDEKILAALQADCKSSFAELAEMVGLSPSACHKRLKAIEECGVIEGYVAILLEDKVGLKSHIFVQVTLKSQKEDVLSAFEKAVARHDEIMECYLMAGDSDFFLRILCHDTEDYERIHNEILTRLPGVDRIRSNFAIRKVFRRTAISAKALRARADFDAI